MSNRLVTSRHEWVIPFGSGTKDCSVWAIVGSPDDSKRSCTSGEANTQICGLSDIGRVGGMEGDVYAIVGVVHKAAKSQRRTTKLSGRLEDHGVAESDALVPSVLRVSHWRLSVGLRSHRARVLLRRVAHV